MFDRQQLENFHNGLDCFAYKFFGCHKVSEGEYVFRVWAPHAKFVSVIGSFNNWDEKLGLMHKLCDDESFEITLPASSDDGYKFCITTFEGRKLYKADPYAFAADYPDCSCSKIVDLPPRVMGKHEVDYGDKPINIYEVSLLSWKRHRDNSYFTYPELENTLVPYVKEMGYTHVEFLPVTEFPFDGSWGYQVTGYFSITSRLGTPEQFISLVEAFHKNGIKVILDWVPAHFPKDYWGLYEFDGQPLYECPLWDRMEHSGWGTRKFDLGRNEIDNFLISSATYLIEQFNIDGLRVDAVASMLYLDYDKKAGDWTPNKDGGTTNLEALSFIRKLNSSIKRNFPHILMIAEESSAYPGITLPVPSGGLGFDYKWNMGWMNDTLFYCRQDPYFRNYHHGKITFSLMYAFNEKYILPLSHDEVVHVKGSIVNKMPGEYADKFAGERALLCYMYAHPGKKLNFMGYEVAQFKEWNYNEGIEFFLKKFEKHRKMTAFVKALNHFYLANKPLYEIEDSWDGFEWLVVDDKTNNLLAFTRYSKDRESITAVINFSGVDIKDYKIGIEEGTYKVVFNSDMLSYGGDGKLKKKIFKTKKQPSHGKTHSIVVNVPKLACIYLKKENN